MCDWQYDRPVAVGVLRGGVKQLAVQLAVLVLVLVR